MSSPILLTKLIEKAEVEALAYELLGDRIIAHFTRSKPKIGLTNQLNTNDKQNFDCNSLLAIVIQLFPIALVSPLLALAGPQKYCLLS